MGRINLKKISKGYDGQEVLSRIDLEVQAGEFLVILGASGGGKTTLLNLIAGLIPPSSGKILFNRQDVTRMDPAHRNVAYVFQDYALYPNMTVEENIRFPLENRKTRKRKIERKVREVLQLLKLTPVLHKTPAQLSGGQKQRVAIGRALVRDPFVFLFDEPLSSLDQQLRDHLRVELKQLHRQLNKTFVYVTHDQLSAMILGDRVAFLADGGIRQIGSPRDLYMEPVSMEVAKFLGFPAINLLGPEDFARLSDQSPPQGTAWVGVRPEHIQVSMEGATRFETEWVQKVGYADYAYFKVGSATVCARCADPAPQPGEQAALRMDPRYLMFFDAKEKRIVTG